MDPGRKIEICSWSPAWREKFRLRAIVLRRVLGPRALRIDHIGSTSIQDLAAKPVIDIQISVIDFEAIEAIAESMSSIGYLWRSDNPEMTKRYFRERPGEERTHIHMRRLGSWHEQWALLFRDYMRSHVEEHAPYIALKCALANRHGDDGAAYTKGKADHLWGVIRRADRWAAAIGWIPGPSDA